MVGLANGSHAHMSLGRTGPALLQQVNGLRTLTGINAGTTVINRHFTSALHVNEQTETRRSHTPEGISKHSLTRSGTV